MKKIYFLTCLLFLVCFFEAQASRALYVDGFASILGNPSAENNLLSYAEANEIEILLLYDLHIVNANYNLSNASTNYVLADFISKAKVSYGISAVGATAENAYFFINVIDAYNNSRNDPNEKFDIYNLEFEFWNTLLTSSNGYYCNTYLSPSGLPCTNAGAFQFFISTLEIMNNLAADNSHSITTEAYIGWLTNSQANLIGDKLDRLRIHAYVSSPNTAFNYVENRLLGLVNSNPNLELSIIFSSEPEFMKNWLTNNSMVAAENIFTENLISASAAWTNNVNLTGFTYFAYSFNTDIVLSTTNENPNKELIVYPNPVQNFLYLRNVDDLKYTRVYNNIGQLILETKEKEIDLSKFNTGIYIFEFHSKQRVETKKIIKE